ncbi:MAG: NAD(P)H-dependent oxidoreductase [Sulfuricella denitrificans]|nr:NAD(P)H-dependent oxidoreductase [Sulfuricella denitrificans]
MKALIVTAHPQQDSFTWALTEQFVAGVIASGHEVEVADLYSEGFNPVVSIAEMAGWQSGLVSPEIRAEQERIRNCDGLILSYPVWWSTPPAILSGWLQRVLTLGFAFKHVGGRTEGQLKVRAQMLVNIGSRQRQDVDLAKLYLEPMIGVLHYCGMNVLPSQANWGVYPQADRDTLQAYIDQAYENGKRFFS